MPLQPPGTLYVQVNLNVGGAAYSTKNPGECNYAPGASIHQSPGQMWRVRSRDAGRDLTFTEWRLGKVDSFTLFLTVDGRTHRINTLQVGPPAERAGSGSVRYEPRGRGGQFSINGVTDTGMKISGTLACSGFVRPEESSD
ncbi:MAG: hypothetical protein QM736_01945 [Vicinamibacterales bacterium]